MSAAIRHLIIIIAITVLSIPAAAQSWGEDFDSHPAGTFPPGWFLKYSGMGADYQEVDGSEYVSAPHSFKLEGATNWVAAAQYTLPYTSDCVRVEVDVLPTEVTTPNFGDNIAGVHLALPGYGVQQPRIDVIFGPSHEGGYVFTWGGDYDHTWSPIQFTPGEWCHVTIVAFFDLRTFSVWIDGELLEQDTLMNGDYWYEVVELHAGNSCQTRTWFDNLEVYWDPGCPVESTTWGAIKAVYR